MKNKKEQLESALKQMGSVAVAFSTGVDSTFLLKTARDVLGDNAYAVTVRSCLIPQADIEEALRFCEKQGIALTVIDHDPFTVEGFRDNGKDRCYLCKKAIFARIKQAAADLGVNFVLEGTNADDMFDYRPGMKALEELGIRSPLKEAGITKEEIRELSREKGLDTWDKPAFACLATRIPCGTKITPDVILRIEEAERYLRDLGFRQYRVRTHGNLARIEVMPDDFGRIMQEDIRIKITDRFKQIGYRYVSVDLGGYRTGSMN